MKIFKMILLGTCVIFATSCNSDAQEERAANSKQSVETPIVSELENCNTLTIAESQKSKPNISIIAYCVKNGDMSIEPMVMTLKILGDRARSEQGTNDDMQNYLSVSSPIAKALCTKGRYDYCPKTLETYRLYVDNKMRSGETRPIRNRCINAIYKSIDGHEIWSKFESLEYMIEHMKPEARRLCLAGVARGKRYSNEHAVLVRKFRKLEITISPSAYNNVDEELYEAMRKKELDHVDIQGIVMWDKVSPKAVRKALKILKGRVKNEPELALDYEILSETLAPYTE